MRGLRATRGKVPAKGRDRSFLQLQLAANKACLRASGRMATIHEKRTRYILRTDLPCNLPGEVGQRCLSLCIVQNCLPKVSLIYENQFPQVKTHKYKAGHVLSVNFPEANMRFSWSSIGLLQLDLIQENLTCQSQSIINYLYLYIGDLLHYESWNSGPTWSVQVRLMAILT